MASKSGGRLRRRIATTNHTKMDLLRVKESSAHFSVASIRLKDGTRDVGFVWFMYFVGSSFCKVQEIDLESYRS